MGYKNDAHWTVYVHINNINGKCYVGMTGRRPERRWGGNGIGYNNKCIHFYRAIQKYGWDNFEHEIVASNLTKKEAENFERLLIEKLKSNQREYGYNIASGGTGGNNKEIISIKQYDLDGNFIAEYKSAADAAKVFGCHRSRITATCKKHGITHGYMFRYADEVVDKPYVSGRHKSVLKFNLNKELLQEYESGFCAAESIGVPKHKIYRAVTNKNHYLNGFLWIYKEDYEKFGFNN